MDQAKGDSVGADAERAPLLCDGLGETEYGGLCSGVVGLANVSVQAGRGGDVDDGAVLALFRLYFESRGGR